VRVFLVLGIHILMIKLVVLLFIRGITSSLNTQKLTVTNKYVGLPYSDQNLRSPHVVRQ